MNDSTTPEGHTTIRLQVVVDTDELREWAGKHADAGHAGVATVLYNAAADLENQITALASIREYAQSLHSLADTTRDAGGDYLAHTYREIATALESKIGDRM